METICSEFFICVKQFLVSRVATVDIRRASDRSDTDHSVLTRLAPVGEFLYSLRTLTNLSGF